MEKPCTKRRGPLTLLATSRKVRRWSTVVAVMLLVPMLYFLSSGPAQTAAFSIRMATASTGAQVPVFDGGWWPKVYRPIWWAVQQPWGGPIKTYLALFPFVRRGPPVATPLPADHRANVASASSGE